MVPSRYVKQVSSHKVSIPFAAGSGAEGEHRVGAGDYEEEEFQSPSQRGVGLRVRNLPDELRYALHSFNPLRSGEWG